MAELSQINLSQYLRDAEPDLSELEDKNRLLKFFDFSQDMTQEAYAELEAAYQQLQDDMDDDDPWYQDVINFVVQTGLNILGSTIGIPIGSLIYGIYEYNDDMSAIENYEAHVAQLQEDSRGTFLEDWADSADDFIGEMKTMVAAGAFIEFGMDMLMPKIYDKIGNLIPQGWQDVFDEVTEPLRAGFDEALHELPYMHDIKNNIIEGADYDEALDVNLDGTIDALDVQVVGNAWGESNLFDRINPFETKEVVEEFTPGEQIFSYDEVAESIMNGEDKFSIGDLTKAAEDGVISLVPEEVEEVLSERLFVPEVYEPGYSEELDPLVITGDEVKGFPGATITHPAVSGTPEWDSLPQSSKDALIASQGLDDSVPYDIQESISRIEFQKQKDFLEAQGKNAIDLRFAQDRGPGSIGTMFPTSTPIHGIDQGGAPVEIKKGYNYNILGEDYLLEEPMSWWDENFPGFEKEWNDMFISTEAEAYDEYFPGTQPWTPDDLIIPQGREVGPKLMSESYYQDIYKDVYTPAYGTGNMAYQPPVRDIVTEELYPKYDIIPDFGAGEGYFNPIVEGWEALSSASNKAAEQLAKGDSWFKSKTGQTPAQGVFGIESLKELPYVGNLLSKGTDWLGGQVDKYIPETMQNYVSAGLNLAAPSAFKRVVAPGLYNQVTGFMNQAGYEGAPLNQWQSDYVFGDGGLPELGPKPSVNPHLYKQLYGYYPQNYSQRRT